MENASTLDYEKFIFATLFILANKLQVVGDKFLEEVTTKQWFLLLMVAQFGDQPPTLGQVAELLGSSHQNTKQLALKLESKGFLTIAKDSEDSRALRLRVTERCYDYFSKRTDKDTNYLNELFKEFTEDEVISLAKGINKLTHGLTNMGESVKSQEFGWVNNLFGTDN